MSAQTILEEMTACFFQPETPTFTTVALLGTSMAHNIAPDQA